MSSSPGDGRGVKKKNRMPRRYGEYAGRGCVIGVFGAGWGTLLVNGKQGKFDTFRISLSITAQPIVICAAVRKRRRDWG